MKIHCDFSGGNIEVAGVCGDRVWIRPTLRDTAGDWFYWAFCVQGAEGRTLTFDFSHDRLGYFGPAISHDKKTWFWAGKETLSGYRKSFTFHFEKDDHCVYFAHHMLYQPERFSALAERIGTPLHTLARTNSGANAPFIRFGDGENLILLTARHHCCESPGSYVLEGALEYLCEHLPKDYFVIAVPFMDMDGVLRGDQGKNRIPHDHNRDYTDSPIYPEVRELIHLVGDKKLRFAFDFHAPWHIGDRNDSVFLVRNLKNPEIQEAFSRLFVSTSEGLPFRYDSRDDIAPNEGWNKPSSCFSDYFAKKSSIELAMTLETTYFGKLEGGCFGQENAVRLGHAFGEALCLHINEGA